MIICIDSVSYTHLMVFAEDSPVVAVIGAHLHFAYDDQLTEKIPQYVFDASFKGTVGVITVK